MLAFGGGLCSLYTSSSTVSLMHVVMSLISLIAFIFYARTVADSSLMYLICACNAFIVDYGYYHFTHYLCREVLLRSVVFVVRFVGLLVCSLVCRLSVAMAGERRAGVQQAGRVAAGDVARAWRMALHERFFKLL